MNCHEFENWLSDVERTHDPTVALSHLAECGSAECRRIWEEQQLIDDAIACWKHDIPQIDVVDRVWSAIERPAAVISVGSAAEGQSNRSAWAALAMTAAIVALGVWTLSAFRSPPGGAPSTIADVPESEPVSEPPLQRYSIASVSLAQSASAFVADAALLTVQDVGDPDDPTRPVSAWATKVSQQLEPWGENFHQAIEYLDEVIPDMSVMRMMPTS